jgi:MoaA/NifB/PqqE/SkfB family radical SAM enzyme
MAATDHKARFDPAGYASMTMEFRCNLHCEHCMIEGTMDRLVPERGEDFEALLAHNREHRRWQGLILTGAEITLQRDLPDLARRARGSGFEHVRIQTHGMHLARKDYLERLVEAGIDEYFVSVAGCDAQTHDAITGVPGSFDKTLQGLANLESFPDVVSLTNTVVTERSYRLLPAIVERLAHLRQLEQMEFWLYWPMREDDDKGLLPRYPDILPWLEAAIEGCRAHRRSIEIKGFPVCLLGADGHLVINGQPNLFIDPSFWQEFMRNGFNQCVYRDRCNASECLGLNTAYVRKYGWEKDALAPLATDPCHRFLRWPDV